MTTNPETVCAQDLCVPMETEILVVEDEPADAELIRELLADDHDIEVVGDVSTAVGTLQALASADATPALVLLDLCLPDGSGFDVLEYLDAELDSDGLSAVVLTNSDSDSDRERARQLGAEKYETKPMDIDEFESTIADIERAFLSVSG